MYGCKAPIVVEERPTAIKDTKIDQQEIKEEKAEKAQKLKEKKVAKEKIEKAKRLELLKNEKIVLEAKKQSVDSLIKNINALGNKKLHTPENIKRAKDYLKEINEKSLSYDSFSTAMLLIKKSRTLFLLARTEEALTLLNKNWELIITGDKKSSLNSPPSAEAYLMLGNLNLSLANNEDDNTKAIKLYKDAVNSYYKVLTLYDSRHCPFSSYAIKGFRNCKKIMKKRFNYNLSFPPEI